ncbi:MAG: hypothetical protein EXS64_14145 [Candidatus Latescibacteria bacterium]|nr:hypothetical protein [Candidatus Latescibacterota bacterium]
MGGSDGLALVGLVGLARPSGAAEVRASLGLERDDNPFKETADRQGGWVSRFYVSASGTLLDRPRWRAKVQHQGGMKRFWLADRRTSGSYGDVVTNDLEVSTLAWLTGRVTLSGQGDLKVKNVHQTPGEAGYLRGTAEGAVTGQFGQGITGAVRYLRGGDDSRAATLPDASLHEAGAEVKYRRSRQFQGRAGVTWRWLTYGRPALQRTPGGGVGFLNVDQSDLLREVSAGFAGVSRDAVPCLLRLSAQPVQQLRVRVPGPPGSGAADPAHRL